ncbi:MAG TPA: UvrD-helicase domain-containing protein [Flavobacterium sp.]|nr:UvrD-helicase domain-containing protein [Flavobacterium sp.]HPJ10317.1 UvrD-helicase domain-containing protein [Flavobacterium sp.]
MLRPSFSIYDASAGSGKTYALVKEYLKIILTAKSNDAYRNILAITFTNKAVHEMKTRIVDSLSEFAKADTNPKALGLMQHISAETQLSLTDIKRKSQQIIKHIIHNYAAFDILTIDKFTHKIIRAFAHDLNLPITFEVSLDTENLLTEAVDALISRAGEDETLTKLLIDFTMEKTDDDKSWDISREILETGRLILNENSREEIGQFKDKTISEFLAVKSKLSEAAKVLELENIALADRAMHLMESNGIDRKSFSRETFPNHFGYIQRGELKSTHKRFHEFEDVAINKTATDKTIIESLIPEWLQILATIYKNFEKRDFYKAFLKNITPLSLLNTLSSELATIQEEQNILSIAAFNAIIHREIQNQPAPFIYERLGERYRHFFIDEFQDTSEMQWLNLIPLIDNATSSEIGGEKGTLMIVGDPKQSIYRWRGGKAEQFIALSKEQNPFNNPEKLLVHLDRNYRSYSQIIDFNNRFFKFLSGVFKNEDYRDLYENKSHQLHNDRVGGYVNLSFLPQDFSEDEDEAPEKETLYVKATVQAIHKALSQGFEYRDIAILTRKRGQGIAVATYLTEQKIPLLSSETLMIRNATEVSFIIHVLKYLRSSLDLESKAQILYYLAKAQPQIPIHDFISQGMAQVPEHDFESWLLSHDLDFSFAEIRKRALYDAVEMIISNFIHPETSNAYLQYFLDIVLERDLRNQAGIADFLEYWDKNSEKFSIPSPEGNNAVRILTIHKSKGLEFPVVIMPFAEEDYNRNPKDKLWLDATGDAIGMPKALVDNSKFVEGLGLSAANVYLQKKQEELLDNINVLYVALTRAVEQLYVISAMTLDKNGATKESNMASFFIDFLDYQGLFETNTLSYEFGSPIRLSERSQPGESGKIIPLVAQRLDPRNIKIAQREALMWGTYQQEAISYGNVIHEILSFVKTKADICSVIAMAVEDGLITVTQQEAVAKTISDIIGHEALLDYFSEQNIIFNEQTIIQKEGRTVKPDRMVLTAQNEMLLLDYKTGLHQPKYQQQLEEYQAAIEKMGYRVTKKALVYIGETINIVNL